MTGHVEQKRRAVDQHSAQADEFAARYARLEAAPYATCFAYSRRRLEHLLAAALPASADRVRLLDVGCGTGHHLAALRARGFDVAGVDGSPEMVAHARANNPGVEIARSDVERLPFPDASFDVVVCIEVLRYLPDIRTCLREMARVLRPGGVCLATAVPVLNLNGYVIVNRLASALRVPGLVSLRQYFTTSRALRRRLVEAGFASASVRGVYLGPVNWVERLAPRALPRLLRAWEPIDARLADAPLIRELSNLYLVRAVRGARHA